MLPLFLAANVAQPNPLSDGQNIFFAYGPVGVLALLGLWFFFRVYNREANRADRESKEKADLMEKVIPLLTEANRVLAEATAILRDQGRARRE